MSSLIWNKYLSVQISNVCSDFIDCWENLEGDIISKHDKENQMYTNNELSDRNNNIVLYAHGVINCIEINTMKSCRSFLPRGAMTDVTQRARKESKIFSQYS